MSRDAGPVAIMETSITSLPGSTATRRIPPGSSRMQYRRRPVSVAVDPVSLVITECITITSAIQKYARSPHSSVSAILGGSPNVVQLGAPGVRGARKSSGSGPGVGGDGPIDLGPASRWGLRGKKGKSMQDNPLISGFARLRHELTGVKGRSHNMQVSGGTKLTSSSRYHQVRLVDPPLPVPSDHTNEGHCGPRHGSCLASSAEVLVIRLPGP